MKRIAVLLLLSSLFFTACATTKWVRTPVVKKGNFSVTLEQRQEKGQIVEQQYAQPCDIDPLVLKKIMQELMYTEKAGLLGKKETNPVFQAGEIESLAPVLADTFAKADASQRLRFTSHNRAKALIFSVSRETEGVMFVEPENRLNIAFSYINTEINPDEINALPPSFSRTDPVKISNATTAVSPVASYSELYRLKNGKPAPMWVVIDLAKVKEIMSRKPAPPVVTQEPVTPESRPAVSTQTAPAPSAPSEDMHQNKMDDIKSKLQYLKDLLDEGLISEDDYNAKKAELLEKIK